MAAQVCIGTSGWHYDDWVGRFYPQGVSGYKELSYHARYFNSVENNSSFYRIAGEGTYKTWYRVTPQGYSFSIKLNRLITHVHQLEVNEAVDTAVSHILNTTQALREKMGAIVIQLPPSFTCDLPRLSLFLAYFCPRVRSRENVFDIAIELRNKKCFAEEVHKVLGRHNVALVAAQSFRYPHVRQLTSDTAYIRMHGPQELFASSYSVEQLKELAAYVRSVSGMVKKVYVYFNNDYYGYAIENALTLKKFLSR